MKTKNRLDQINNILISLFVILFIISSPLMIANTFNLFSERFGHRARINYLDAVGVILTLAIIGCLLFKSTTIICVNLPKKQERVEDIQGTDAQN